MLSTCAHTPTVRRSVSDTRAGDSRANEHLVITRRQAAGYRPELYGARRITTRGVFGAAFEVVGAATVKPARSNIAAVPV